MNTNPFSGNFTFKKPYDNDSSDDNYISPQDISIKDEKIWDPTDEEIIAYAAKLGYDIEKDPDELFEVAYYYMKYPLPEGWKRGVMKTSKELVYINLVDGEIEVSTEIEEMAHQMYLEKKAEMNQKSLFRKSPEKEKTTVVPRKKIPPLNPLQKSNNSNGLKGSLPSIKDLNSNKKSNNNNFHNNNNALEKNDIFKSKNIVDKNTEDLIRLNNNIDKFLEKSLSEKSLKEMANKNNKDKEKEISKDKSKEKNIIKENYKIIKNPEKNLNIEIDNNENKKNNYLLYNLENEEDEEMEEEEDSEIFNKKLNEEKEDDFLEKMLKKDKEIEALRKQKEKDIAAVLSNNEELKKIIDIKNLNLNSEENKESILNKEKKNYLKKKLEELKEYKEKVKFKYDDRKEKFEKEKKNEYEKKLKEELKNKKEKLKKQYEEKIELYEKQLINKKNKEEKKFKEELINLEKNKTEGNKELIKKKIEKEKLNLKNKKQSLLDEIEKLKKIKNANNANLSEKKMNIQKNLRLFEEKKNIEKKNKQKKTELDIKNIEYEKEKEFSEIKAKLIEKNNNENLIINKPKIISDKEMLEQNLLNDIQQALNEEFEITKKEIEQELKNQKLKEIDKYTTMITNEKNDKINLMKLEIISTEKDYYKSVSDIRTNSQKIKFDKENNLKVKFEQTLTKYENIKKIILEEYQELIKHISDNLKKLMVENYTLKHSERKFEEFLSNLKDNYMIIYQKHKNNFDMHENDFIFKVQFIKYLLDVVNYMIKLFSSMKAQINENSENSNNNKNNKVHIELAENLILFCNNKIHEYSKKYKKNKNISIFKIMNGNMMKSQSFENSRINEFDDINETLNFDITSHKRNSTKKDNKQINKLNNKNMNTNTIIFSKEDINETINNTTKNNELNELTFIQIDQENNLCVPIISEKIVSNISKDISTLYSDITEFLKEEFNKIVEINNKEKQGIIKNKINTSLNLIILDKIRLFSQEAFNYLLTNYKNSEKQLNIKKKLRLILNHIEEYKNHFDLDKYLLKNKSNKKYQEVFNNNINNFKDSNEENDIINQNNYKFRNNKTNYNKYSLNNNYINNRQDISNFSKTNYKKNNIEKNDKEEQKQSSSIDEVNISKSLNNNFSNNSQLNGRFNNFFRQYSSNSLAEEITNPILYQFFNYKKNKYELDKSLGKLSIP